MLYGVIWGSQDTWTSATFAKCSLKSVSKALKIWPPLNIQLGDAVPDKYSRKVIHMDEPFLNFKQHQSIHDPTVEMTWMTYETTMNSLPFLWLWRIQIFLRGIVLKEWWPSWCRISTRTKTFGSSLIYPDPNVKPWSLAALAWTAMVQGEKLMQLHLTNPNEGHVRTALAKALGHLRPSNLARALRKENVSRNERFWWDENYWKTIQKTATSCLWWSFSPNIVTVRDNMWQTLTDNIVPTVSNIVQGCARVEGCLKVEHASLFWLRSWPSVAWHCGHLPRQAARRSHAADDFDRLDLSTRPITWQNYQIIIKWSNDIKCIQM